jgi:hypothetical protein
VGPQRDSAMAVSSHRGPIKWQCGLGLDKRMGKHQLWSTPKLLTAGVEVPAQRTRTCVGATLLSRPDRISPAGLQSAGWPLPR